VTSEHQRHSPSPLYDNCSVQSPNGVEMFRCNKAKINWYLRKNLADIVENQERLTIRLKFEPKGLGWAGDDFYLQDRQNCCCVCGAAERLTKHHVVPHSYREHMDTKEKESNYYDVLPLCVDCHTKYEYHATERKKELAKLYNAPMNGINNPCTSAASLYATTLIKHGKKIPTSRKQEMLDKISFEVGRKIQENEVHEFAKIHRRAYKHPQYRSHSQLVLDCVKSAKKMQSFVEDWRKHFVDIMKPKFLPPQWEVSRDFYGKKANKEN